MIGHPGHGQVSNISVLVPLVVSVLSANSSTTDQAASIWNSSLIPENISTSILSSEPTTMTVTRVTVNSSLDLQPTTLTPVLKQQLPLPWTFS